jgi:hypothetical protein
MRVSVRHCQPRLYHTGLRRGFPQCLCKCLAASLQILRNSFGAVMARTVGSGVTCTVSERCSCDCFAAPELDGVTTHDDTLK